MRREYNPVEIPIKELEGKCGVYQIRNLVNGKIYIGSSNNIKKRFISHLSYLRRNIHENIHLQRAYNKYGEENLAFEVIEFCTIQEQFLFEQYWIDNFIKEDCYNINPVASKPPSNKGRKREPISEEVRKRQSEAQKLSFKNNPERAKKMSRDRMGKHMGADHVNSVPIVCLETGVTYAGISEAERKTGYKNISLKAITSNGFHWVYKTQYDKMTKEDIDKKLLQTKGGKVVVCLETGKYYKKAIDAMKDTGADRNCIIDCCNGITVEAKGLHWAYQADYEKMSSDDINNKLKEHYTCCKKCLCVDTQEVFDSISEAARTLNLSLSKISLVCQGKRKSTGGLHFMFYEDYLRNNPES